MPELHHHHHLVCIQCHKTFEFSDESILKIGKKQVEKAGVELLDCQLTVRAVCLEALREGWPSLIPSNWLCPQYHSEIEGETIDGALSTVPTFGNQATSESQR